MHFQRTGSGPPLVLLHGLGGVHAIWTPVLPLLERERGVIAPDLPGFGRSDPLANGAAPTAAALAGAVGELLDELGIERAHVAGNSLGGWVALELAKLGRADSVTALSPAGLWRRPLGPRPGVQRRAVGRALGPLLRPLMRSERVRRRVLASSVAHPERVPPDAAAEIVMSYLASPGYDAANREMRASVFEPDGLPDVPVTIAWADRDQLVGRPKRLPPGARYVELRGCGHVPTWDDPEQVARVLLDGSAVLASSR